MANGDYRLETAYPVPECGEDDIIIKTEGCGICAGDLKCQHGAAMFWGDEKEAPWVKPPFIPGHEFVGRIVKMGSQVKGFSLGDRITADQIGPLRRMPVLQERQILDVPASFHFRIPEYQQRRNGGICEIS